ncbi:MAG: heme-dependent oxidative N-demethylase subunit alpha family protein [Thiohalomonadales bacterium]
MHNSFATRKIAKYFPLVNGKYEVKPGLFSLKQDFGNQDQDNYVFQIDQQFSHYRQNKLNAHNELLTKYFCSDNFSNSQQHVTRFLINTLCDEHPQFFTLSQKNNNLLFKCKLTNDDILLSNNFEILSFESLNYTNLFDAVMMQVQEDIAIITEDDHISCLHLMAPNFWSAPGKIGKNFSTIHQEVAGIETIIKNSKAIINAMIYKGPYVRFAWGICSDNELNHHPDNQGTSLKNNKKIVYGRIFNPEQPCLFLRVERQTITGLPEIKCAIFTIRTYLYNIQELDKIEIQSIINAINSMTNKQLKYKGLSTTKSAIIKWLSSLL